MICSRLFLLYLSIVVYFMNVNKKRTRHSDSVSGSDYDMFNFSLLTELNPL